MTDIRATTLAQLRALLTRARDTEVGRELAFASMLGREDADMRRAFADALPPADYERYRSKLARMREAGIELPGQPA